MAASTRLGRTGQIRRVLPSADPVPAYHRGGPALSTRMENLFRLMLVPAGREPGPRHPSIELAQESDLPGRAAGRRRLRRRPAGHRDRLRRLRRLAGVRGSIDGPPLGAEARRARRPDRGARRRAEPWHTVRELVEEIFGQPARELLDTDPYLRPSARLRDSLIAIKILQELHQAADRAARRSAAHRRTDRRRGAGALPAGGATQGPLPRPTDRPRADLATVHPRRTGRAAQEATGTHPPRARHA